MFLNLKEVQRGERGVYWFKMSQTWSFEVLQLTGRVATWLVRRAWRYCHWSVMSDRPIGSWTYSTWLVRRMHYMVWKMLLNSIETWRDEYVNLFSTDVWCGKCEMLRHLCLSHVSYRLKWHIWFFSTWINLSLKKTWILKRMQYVVDQACYWIQ